MRLIVHVLDIGQFGLLQYSQYINRRRMMMRNTGKRTLREFNQGPSALSVPPVSIQKTHSLQITTQHPLCGQHASSAILLPVPSYPTTEQTHHQPSFLGTRRPNLQANVHFSTEAIRSEYHSQAQPKTAYDYLSGTYFEKKGRLVEGAQLAALCFEDSESEEDYDLGIIGMKTHTTSTIDEDQEELNYYEDDEDSDLTGLFPCSQQGQHQQTSSVSKQCKWGKRNQGGRSLRDL